jgi:hypothetical protein
MPGVVKLVPVPKLVPPVATSYQLTVPADAVAPRVTVPLSQTLPGVVAVIVGIALTVVVILLLSAGLPVAHGEAFELKQHLPQIHSAKLKLCKSSPFLLEHLDCLVAIDKTVMFHR